MRNNVIAVALVALLIGGAIGFFGGTQYQKRQRGQFMARDGSVQMRNGRNGNGPNGVMGSILSVDKNSITVKSQDGNSKIVILTSSTSINKAAQGSISDLTTGTQVAVFGTTNSDGSVTATNVQINPVMRGPGSPSGAKTP